MDERISMRLAALLIAPVLAGIMTPASAQVQPYLSRSNLAMTEAAAALGPNRYLWQDAGGDGPVSVLISIPDQRAYVFRGERMIGAATVSTGSDDRPTPTGSFTILQKAADHKSNLYDDAPMPFMQRLTWDGVALHAGRNPGFPASHGCVRLPTGFAKKLFAVTSLGATVEVTDDAYVAGSELASGDADAVAEANRVASREPSMREVERALAAR
jgi:hypothetical protein